MPGASCDVPGILLLAGRVWPQQLGRSEALIPYRGSTTTFWKAPVPVPT